MSWKKHFTVYHGEQITNDPSEKKKKNGSMAQSRFQSWLPEVYSGMSNRVERYVQFDQMDMDSEINAALDTIAEFSSQIDDETETPFMIHYHSDPTESEASVIGEALTQWSNLNDWDKRMFRTLRNTFKYGDQPFIRDPETWVLHYVNPSDVSKIIVDEAKGKEPAQYIIKNVSLNVANKTATDPLPYNDYSNNKSGISSSGLTAMNSRGADISSTGDPSEETTVDATHVIHVSLSEGMDPNYPFGSSILDPIFKTYKQKELLEDAIIIYRVQRAPERRVFYIDTGDMPPHRAMAFVERVKNEVHQRRIPNKNGGGQSMLDAQYNPMSILEDYFFSQSSDGRGSKVDVLPGGEQLGEIDDLKFFTNKMMRALRVPSSYMPTGPEDGTATFNDGRVGTAFIQEFRFTQFCKRLQNLVQPTMDREFKLFLKHRGYNIDSGMFDIRLTEPQSFSQYRQIDIDSARAGLFSQIGESSYISKRFALKKYLGLSEAEILENEKMWMEENKDKVDGTDTDLDQDDVSDLGSMGISPAGEDFGGEEFGDEEFGDEDFGDDESPISGAEGEEGGDIEDPEET